MTLLDRLYVRRPGPIARLLGAVLIVLGLIVLGNSTILILGGGWLSALLGCLAMGGSVATAKLGLPLMLVHWETTLDRQWRTVTQRSRFVRMVSERRYRFEDFTAVEVRFLGGEQVEGPRLFAIVLVGPGVAFDIDDPGPVPSAALFRLLARVAASYNRPGRLALAAALADFGGWPLVDGTGQLDWKPGTTRRPLNAATFLESGEMRLLIPRVPLGMRVAAVVMMIAGTAALVLVATILPLGGGLPAAKTVIGLLAVAFCPVAGALSLSYRSRVEIDFPSRLVRRTGSFLGIRWDETYTLDQFEAVVVREVKIPVQRSPVRSVCLSGGFYEIEVYDTRSVPRRLRSARAVKGRSEQCLASAETLAALCGLPMRVVRMQFAGPKTDRRA